MRSRKDMCEKETNEENSSSSLLIYLFYATAIEMFVKLIHHTILFTNYHLFMLMSYIEAEEIYIFALKY